MKPHPVPADEPRGNRTVLGCGKGTVTVKSSLTEPLIPHDDWEMLQDEPTEHSPSTLDSS